jgi:hypothetical protein
VRVEGYLRNKLWHVLNLFFARNFCLFDQHYQHKRRKTKLPEKYFFLEITKKVEIFLLFFASTVNRTLLNWLVCLFCHYRISSWAKDIDFLTFFNFHGNTFLNFHFKKLTFLIQKRLKRKTVLKHCWSLEKGFLFRWI